MCAELPGSATTPRVTACRKEDIREVEAILQACPEASAWSEDSLLDTLDRHGSYFLLWRQGEEIAGFICGRRIGEEGEVLNLAVKPSFRRQGIGKALVQALRKILAEEGVGQVFLEVRESNAHAIAFYETFGFCEIDRRERYYRDPIEAALVLAARLGSPANNA